MTKKFSIYKPDQFYWTITYISCAFISGVVLIILALKFLLNIPETHPIYKFLYFAIFIPFIYRIACSVLVVNKYRPLKGKLEGHIIFNKDSIEIANHVYLLDDIRYIVLEGKDWLGDEKFYRGFRNYFENTLSQGVDNTLSLFLFNGRVIKTRFQKLLACELREVEDVILHYYLNNKITYMQTVEILCIVEKERQNILKEMKLS